MEQQTISGRGRLNYLLVMPRLVQKADDGYAFPLGIAYVSSSMKRAGYATFTVNLNHRDGNVADVLRDEIARHRIDVVATGGLSTPSAAAIASARWTASSRNWISWCPATRSITCAWRTNSLPASPSA
jgi:putative N-acetylmannosamine-6-phosphate epimerase